MCLQRLSEIYRLRNYGDAKPVFFFFFVAATALGRIPSCRASETHGQKPGGNICACPGRWFMANLLFHYTFRPNLKLCNRIHELKIVATLIEVLRFLIYEIGCIYL